MRYLILLACAAVAAPVTTVEPDLCTLRTVDGDQPGVTVFIERECRRLTKAEWAPRKHLDTTVTVKQDTTK